MILPCTCTSAYQDKALGKGNRFFNTCSGKNTGKYRCTVCGKDRLPGEARALKRDDIPVAKSASARKRLSAKKVRTMSKRGG